MIMAEWTVSGQWALDSIAVTVTITNTDAVHHVPTDNPGRHMILVVTTVDAQGRTLPLHSGPTVPNWGGAQAGMPGKAFAKVLRDIRTGEAPVVSYWRQTLITSDNRIPAMDGDRSTYIFGAASAGERRWSLVLVFFGGWGVWLSAEGPSALPISRLNWAGCISVCG